MTNEIKNLKRGMLVKYPDGSIERVEHTGNFGTNTKFRKKGARMYFDREHFGYVQSGDFKVLGFVKP